MLQKFTAIDIVPRHHTPSHSGRGPLHSQFFHCNLNFVEDIFPCYSILSCKLWYQVASNLCTCHDITAVVACAQVCSNHMTKIQMKTKWHFSRILNYGPKIFSEMVLRTRFIHNLQEVAADQIQGRCAWWDEMWGGWGRTQCRVHSMKYGHNIVLYLFINLSFIY